MASDISRTRRKGLLFGLAAVLLAAAPAAAQDWEGHVTGLRALGNEGLGGGFTFGGGAVIGERIGFEAELGYLGETHGGAPLVSVGGNWRLTPERRMGLFLSGGFARFGDLADVYAGGGLRIGLSPRTAIRVELRGMFPAADLRGCVPTCGSVSRSDREVDAIPVAALLCWARRSTLISSNGRESS
jgi:hypothetical protein